MTVSKKNSVMLHVNKAEYQKLTQKISNYNELPLDYRKDYRKLHTEQIELFTEVQKINGMKYVSNYIAEMLPVWGLLAYTIYSEKEDYSKFDFAVLSDKRAKQYFLQYKHDFRRDTPLNYMWRENLTFLVSKYTSVYVKFNGEYYFERMMGPELILGPKTFKNYIKNINTAGDSLEHAIAQDKLIDMHVLPDDPLVDPTDDYWNSFKPKFK